MIANTLDIQILVFQTTTTIIIIPIMITILMMMIIIITMMIIITNDNIIMMMIILIIIILKSQFQSVRHCGTQMTPRHTDDTVTHSRQSMVVLSLSRGWSSRIGLHVSSHVSVRENNPPVPDPSFTRSAHVCLSSVQLQCI